MLSYGGCLKYLPSSEPDASDPTGSLLHPLTITTSLAWAPESGSDVLKISMIPTTRFQGGDVVQLLLILALMDIE